MDEKRKVEVVVSLLASYIAEKGFRPLTLEQMERKLVKEAEDIGTKDWILFNFTKALVIHLAERSFSADEFKVRKELASVVDLGTIDNVALKVLKYELKSQGIRLQDDNRRLNQIAKSSGLTIEEVVTVLNPLLHEIVNEIFVIKKLDEQG